MEGGKGVIVCSVQKWCDLVKQLTAEQLDTLRHYPDIHCMIGIPSIRMREILIEYMVQIYHPKTATFVVKPKVGIITATGVDVECIYGLKNRGLCVAKLLTEEESNFITSIPPHFLSKSTKNLVIDDLITDIIEGGSCDADFVRMTALVLLGTVLAPKYSKIVPRNYYVLVNDLDRFNELNLNQFTLKTLIDGITACTTKARKMNNFPDGNVSLLQVHTILYCFYNFLHN